MPNRIKLGLALSGGGVRAAVFHLGVLLRLAREGRLEDVEQISTVSGGSLMVAVAISLAARWPGSQEFCCRSYPALRTLFTSTDLLSVGAIGLMGLFRFNLQLLIERAQVLADLLESQWGVKGVIADLPDRPLWWINATCLETGKNWRFSKREMGDWQFGRHYAPPYRLADAVAASAAVPYAIGALALKLPTEGWYRTDPATRKPLERIVPPQRSVRLWDGGAYENLGLEPLYKPQGLVGCDFLICSDASGPLPRSTKSRLSSLLEGQLVSPRLFDIASDQIRSLRSRMLMRSIEGNEIRGALIRIGNSVRDIDIKVGKLRPAETYDVCQTEGEVALAFNHPTDLRAISTAAFDRIARHGFEVADRTLTTYAQEDFSTHVAWI